MSNCIKRTRNERDKKYVYKYYKYVHYYLVLLSTIEWYTPNSDLRTRLLSTGTPSTPQYRVYRCTIADYLVILDDFYQEWCTCTEYLDERQRVGRTCVVQLAEYLRGSLDRLD